MTLQEDVTGLHKFTQFSFWIAHEAFEWSRFENDSTTDEG